MAVIVEDGSGVSDANSYVSVADARAYAEDRGITLSPDDAVLSGQVVQAADYIDSFDFVGQVVSFAQAMQWPRTGVQYPDGTAFPSDAIPTQLVKAQNEAIIAIFQGVILQPNTNPSVGGFVTFEKVGPIETKYSESIGVSGVPLVPKVMAALEGLLNTVPVLKTIRV